MILHAPLALLAGLFILSITIAAPGAGPDAMDPVAQQTIAFLR
jgi:hypothetical protein